MNNIESTNKDITKKSPARLSHIRNALFSNITTNETKNNPAKAQNMTIIWRHGESKIQAGGYDGMKSDSEPLSDRELDCLNMTGDYPEGTIARHAEKLKNRTPSEDLKKVRFFLPPIHYTRIRQTMEIICHVLGISCPYSEDINLETPADGSSFNIDEKLATLHKGEKIPEGKVLLGQPKGGNETSVNAIDRPAISLDNYVGDRNQGEGTIDIFIGHRTLEEAFDQKKTGKKWLNLDPKGRLSTPSFGFTSPNGTFLNTKQNPYFYIFDEDYDNYDDIISSSKDVFPVSESYSILKNQNIINDHLYNLGEIIIRKIEEGKFPTNVILTLLKQSTVIRDYLIFTLNRYINKSKPELLASFETLCSDFLKQKEFSGETLGFVKTLYLANKEGNTWRRCLHQLLYSSDLGEIDTDAIINSTIIDEFDPNNRQKKEDKTGTKILTPKEEIKRECDGIKRVLSIPTPKIMLPSIGSVDVSNAYIEPRRRGGEFLAAWMGLGDMEKLRIRGVSEASLFSEDKLFNLEGTYRSGKSTALLSYYNLVLEKYKKEHIYNRECLFPVYITTSDIEQYGTAKNAVKQKLSNFPSTSKTLVIIDCNKPTISNIQDLGIDDCKCIQSIYPGQDMSDIHTFDYDKVSYPTENLMKLCRLYFNHKTSGTMTGKPSTYPHVWKQRLSAIVNNLSTQLTIPTLLIFLEFITSREGYNLEEKVQNEDIAKLLIDQQATYLGHNINEAENRFLSGRYDSTRYKILGEFLSCKNSQYSYLSQLITKHTNLTSQEDIDQFIETFMFYNLLGMTGCSLYDSLYYVEGNFYGNFFAKSYYERENISIKDLITIGTDADCMRYFNAILFDESPGSLSFAISELSVLLKSDLDGKNGLCFDLLFMINDYAEKIKGTFDHDRYYKSHGLQELRNEIKPRLEFMNESQYGRLDDGWEEGREKRLETGKQKPIYQ